jgi:HAD superfamily hydrolase (TIGR01549 family)
MPRAELPIRAVFFDLGGTLVDVDDPLGWSGIARGLGVEVEPEHLMHAVRELDRATDGPDRPGVAEFWQRILEQVADGKAGPAIGERFAERLAALPLSTHLFSDVKRCLNELRRERRPLGIISNSRSEESVRDRLEVAGIRSYFNTIVSSGTEHVQKPDRAIFERAAARAGVAPAESFHVGDLAYLDAKAASLAGFRSVWLNRSGTGLGTDPPEITTLTELPAYLRNLERRPR